MGDQPRHHAARLSWERAQTIADAYPPMTQPGGYAHCSSHHVVRIAWRVHDHVAGDRFDELRELCAAAGNKASLAIGMAGLVIDHVNQDRMREASQLATEALAFIESIGDPILTVGLSSRAYAKMHSAESSDMLHWSQTVIDLADGDPSMGNFIFGSPLAVAFADAWYGLLLPGSS